jgi:hypothetical protein
LLLYNSYILEILMKITHVTMPQIIQLLLHNLVVDLFPNLAMLNILINCYLLPMILYEYYKKLLEG